MSTSENNNYTVVDVANDVSLTALAITVGSKYLMSWLGYYWTNISFEQVKNAVIVPLSDLRSIAKSSDKNRLVMVKGYVKPLSSTIISEGSGKEGVLLNRVQISKLDFLSPFFTRTISTMRKVPFLVALNGSSECVVVDTNPKFYVNFTRVCTKVHSKVEPTVTKFLGMDFPSVVQVEEKMLLLGEYLSVIGNVSIRKDGTPQIKADDTFVYFLSHKGLADMEIELSRVLFYFQTWKTIYGSAFAILLFYIIFIRNQARLEAFFERLKHCRQAKKQIKKNVEGEGGIAD